jgi:hypothetical protein
MNNNLIYIGPSYNNLGNHLIKGKCYHTDLVMFGNQNRYIITELESEDPIRMCNGGYAYFELKYFKSKQDIRNDKLEEILNYKQDGGLTLDLNFQ